MASAAPGASDAMGRIHSIVMSAHKWGGDGHRPIFRKIRARLTAEHPEVVAKAFGGDPNKAAGWVKARWYQLRGRPVPATRGKHALSLAAYGEADSEIGLAYNEISDEFKEHLDTLGVTHELFLAEGDAATVDGDLIWKTVARTGKWEVSPIPGGEPLVIDEPFIDDMVTGFKENAWPHVTVPLSHKDKITENTGFVRKLEKVEDPDRPGEYKLRAGLEFTEPDVRGKVARGTIANTSIGADLRGVKRTEDGKFFPRVLKHVALTNAPWLNGLEPFGSDGVMASLASYELNEDPEYADIDAFDELDQVGGPEGFEQAIAEEGDDELLAAGQDESAGQLYLRMFTSDKRDQLARKGHAMPDGSYPIETIRDLKNAIQSVGRASDPAKVKAHIIKRAKALNATNMLPDSWKQNLSASQAEGAVLRLYRGGDNMGEDNTVTMTKDELEQFIAESIAKDREAQSVRLSQAEQRLHQADVKEIVRDLQEKGHAAAVVKQAEEILLATPPEAESVLTLSIPSEDGEGDPVERKLGVREIVLSLLEAVPASSLHLDQPKGGRVSNKPADNDVRKNAKERAAELWEDMTDGDKSSLTA